MGAHGGAENGERRVVKPRAVVWSPRTSKRAGAGASDSQRQLLDVLAKKGAEAVEVQSDLWAMAHACLHQAGGALLVLCEPRELREPAQVVLALRKYAPGVLVYAYEPGSARLLRPVTDQDLVDWGAPGREPAQSERLPAPRAVGKLSLRLVEGEPRPIGPSLPITEHVAGGGSTERTADVLSAEELAMLLGRNGTGGAGTDGSSGAGSAKGDQR